MTISMYAISVQTFVPMLDTLSRLLDKGAEQARAKGDDPDALTKARLAPDMFPLLTQVQLSCHHAEEAVARLTGATPPKTEDLPKNVPTLAELKAHIGKTLAILRAADTKSFEGSEDRRVEMPLQGPIHIEARGFEFLRDWTLPHFYFHIVTAYDILRHSGAEFGKRDYMGIVGPHIRQSA